MLREQSRRKRVSWPSRVADLGLLAPLRPRQRETDAGHGQHEQHVLDARGGRGCASGSGPRRTAARRSGRVACGAPRPSSVAGQAAPAGRARPATASAVRRNGGWRNSSKRPKSKAEIRKNPEGRNPKMALETRIARIPANQLGATPFADASACINLCPLIFGLRGSAFFRISDFGFRIFSRHPPAAGCWRAASSSANSPNAASNGH